MIKYLLDTNIVIGLLSSDRQTLTLLDNITLEECALSQITRMELLGFPRLTSTEREQISHFLSQCNVILLDEIIEESAIEFRATKGLKLPDAIIAATATVKQLELLTFDQKLKDRMA